MLIFLCFPLDESDLETEMVLDFLTIPFVTNSECGAKEVFHMYLKSAFILERFWN